MTILFCCINCKNPGSKADLQYGANLFRDKCSACHWRGDGYKNAPSLITIYHWDSVTLVKRLWKIKGDSIHKGHFEPYNAKEVNSIYCYLRNYFEPRY